MQTIILRHLFRLAFGVVCFVAAVSMIFASLAPRQAHAEIGDDFYGSRSSAMGGAHLGLGDSNDTLFANPAGMAFAKRYHADLLYGYNGRDEISRSGISIVDSKTSPVAAGIAYQYYRGNDGETQANAHRVLGGLAYPFAQYLSVGLQVGYDFGDFQMDGVEQDAKHFHAGAGIMAQLGNGLGLGVSALNLVGDEANALNAPEVKIGAAYRFQQLSLAADFDILTDADDSAARYQYHTGLEYFAGGTAPLRLGYERSPYLKKSGTIGQENFMTAGIGYINPTGAIDLAYRASFERSKNWTLMASLKLYLSL